MNEQELKALNDELLEWAGWHWEKNEISNGCFIPILLSPAEELIEGHIGYIPEHKPNLTQSLDACFKWLVPELKERGYWFIFTGHTFKTGMWIARVKSNIFEVSGKGDTLALALCLAIEKLIEGEGK